MNVIKENTEIRFYRESDWENVRNFIHNYWRNNHPICRKELFDWQHKGFGYGHNEVSPLLLIHNEEVVGFRGVIPGLYQVPSKNREMKIIKGGSCPMWMIQKDFRGIQSFKMYLRTLHIFSIITAAGINLKTAMKFHKRNNFFVLDALHRYVFPLNDWGYQKLISQKVDRNQIKKWITKLTHRNKTIIKPTIPDSKKIAILWEKISFPQRIFSLYRNSDFWNWRYIDSKGFKYLFFGDTMHSGTIVARVEKIISEKNKCIDGENILRIIEILPSTTDIWEGKNDEKLSELIQGVLNWALNENCLMVDFQCSSNRFEKVLSDIGFLEQNKLINEPICSVPSLFQPLCYDFSPINAACRIANFEELDIEWSWDSTYMVKSESDQDRPNL